MKTRTVVSLGGVALMCMVFSGCMARIMDFTLISTKNVDIPGAKGERVKGEDISSIIIFIPTGQPNIKTAVDHAIENGHGDMLVDGVISNTFWYIPYVYGQAGFIAEGTVVDTRKAPARAAAPAQVARRTSKKAMKAAEAAAPETAAPETAASATAAPEPAEGSAAPAAVPASADGSPAPAEAEAEASPEPAEPHVAQARISPAEVAAELLP
jgi:hypothetical protein